jgi:hypothetical protein
MSDYIRNLPEMPGFSAIAVAISAKQIFKSIRHEAKTFADSDETAI